jgi:hypothetical protein
VIGMQTQEMYPAHQVFTFCGHISDDDALSLKSGYVVADSPQFAITSMQEYGFSITAISSLAEIRETISIMQLIAERNPEVEESEFLDLLPEKMSRYSDGKVFTYVGRHDDSANLKMGFVIAPDTEYVTMFLHSHHFTVHSITSLEDLRIAESELKQLADGDLDCDDCGCLNLKLNS